ncbi:MAG: hypothetical protein MUF01_08125 [Bryobacterales bacterium]|jgi:hypothetical protein|nr:hypothetical protein [Bryobacterales bacterium]
MKIGLPKPAQLLSLATKMAGAGLGGPIGAALGAAFQLGKSASEMKSTLSNLQSALNSGAPRVNAQTPSQPQPFNRTTITIHIHQQPLQAATQSPNQRYTMPPIVGNDSQWPAFSQAANARITGGGAALFDGTNPWTKNDGRIEERAAVGMVLQQNDSLRYDADNKMFYTTSTNGVRTDKLALNDVVNTIRAHGGATQDARSFSAVGKLANEAANTPGAATPQQNPMKALADVFKQLSDVFGKILQQLAGGQQNAAKSISDAFEALGKSLSGAGGGSAASSPMFSGGLSAMGGGGSVSGGPGQQAMGIRGTGDGASGSSFTSAPASAGSPSAGSAPGGGNLDSMMSQAEKLLRSDKMEDQIKGQKMMQQAMRMFELISKLIEKQSEMQSKAIAAIK